MPAVPEPPERPEGKKLGRVNGWVLYRGTDGYFFERISDEPESKGGGAR
jgi:hypothetical protein